ncbi:hypothetical protein HX109_13410 [Galbibacter sp. BG1]|uniref:hypothetical protein n=1 Tax=Galbibacter sp. BG1 TaxID=1170699 RepID=UPI0015BE7FE0|nr:hypothetical protein [Galbibacter sp. BG1]QLE02505.1 hypothetical protein HX109_13410 [Galbibacter sp. BG1]
MFLKFVIFVLLIVFLASDQDRITFKVVNKSKHTLSQIRLFAMNLEETLAPTEETKYYQVNASFSSQEAVLMLFSEGVNYGIYVPVPQENGYISYIVDSIDVKNRNIMVTFQAD